MAGETTTSSFSDTIYAEDIERDMQLELRPQRIFRMHLRPSNPTNRSKVYSFTYLDDSGSTTYAYTTEGTTDFIAGTLTAQTTSQSSATAAITAIATLVTDLAEVTSVVPVESTTVGAMGRHMAEAYDAAAQAVIDNFANSTGGATTGTLARLLSVISALEQRDLSANQNLVGGIHPVQTADLRADSLGLASTFQAGQAANINGVLMSALDGYVGDPFGVPVFQSTTISSSGGAYLGWVMASGEAVGRHEPPTPGGGEWLGRVEFHRNIGKIGDEVVCSNFAGFALIDDNKLQGWKSTT